jgi:predicted RNase H-related nuclease YkuK (DUF458 family)
MKNEIPVFDDNTLFRSLSNNVMTFEQVYEEIIKFIKADTNCSYTISVGTDSQVTSRTVLVSCIHVHRVGRGAIGFLHKSEMQRPIFSLREKIYLETYASLQLAYMFNDSRIRRINSIVNSNKKNRGVTFEFHIDVGTKGKTKTLINEMVGMVRGSMFVPKIKPDSYCASSFADRYTKAI